MMKQDPMTILTLSSFPKFVWELVENQSDKYTGSLEEYLRSLLSLVRRHQEDRINFSLLGLLLEQSFQELPLPFEADWRTNKIPASEEEPADDFAALEQTLLFQISDLKLMAENGLSDNELRYFGLESPSGNRWYNFDPFTYLECAAAGWHAHHMDISSRTNCTWRTLENFLELGRLYE